jgi:hypothetical protein
MKKEQCLAEAATAANIVLAGGGVVCLLALLYFIYYYAWTGQRQFTSFAGMATYCGFPAILAIALFASLTLTRAYRITVAAVCLSIAVSAYGMELSLRRSDPLLPARNRPFMSLPGEQRKAAAAKLAEQFGVDIDTRDRQDVIAGLKDQGIDAVPQIVLPLLERQQDNSWKPAINIQGLAVMPLGGIADRVTVVCNETGKYLIYRSDEHGFHNPKGIWESVPIDIAAVGNSLTLGGCVSSERNFVSLIRRRYPATLNLGMPGEGPLHILGVLREYAPAVAPKIVLWFYGEANTFTELQYERRSPLLMSYLRDDFAQGLRARQQDMDRALADDIPRQTALEMSRRAGAQPKSGKLIDKFPAFIKLSALREKLGVVYGKPAQEPEGLTESEAAELEPDLILLRDALSKADARVRAWGGTLYFVYLPGWAHYAESPDLGVKARARVLEVVNRLALPLIDAYSAFQAHADPLSLFPFRGPGRYSEEGHRLVAETVLNALSRRHPSALNPGPSTEAG